MRVTVCKGGGVEGPGGVGSLGSLGGGVVVSEFSVAWGKREDGREFSFLTA